MNYFSTFSGIGGFEYGIEAAFNSYFGASQKERSEKGRYRNIDEGGMQFYDRQRSPVCVGYSEIDKYAKAIYEYQYPKHRNYGDITNINESELPNFDLFVGGFPCQSFSIAGKRQGFEDTRGTLFFDVARILSSKKPTWFILENVKGLLNHDNGRTIGTIFRVLSELGYTVGWEVVNSCHVCVPQNRERIFIIGCTSAERIREVFPITESKEISIEKSGEREKSGNDIASTITSNYRKGVHGCGESYVAGTLRTHKDGEGFREVDSGLCPTIPARAREDGSGQPIIKGVLIDERIRRLTPIECERLQDFPDNWTKYGIFEGVKKEISDTQRYKCLGNAVTTGVIELIITKILQSNNNHEFTK